MSDILTTILARKAEIERVLSEVVGAPVTVKGKRAERLGAIGRREGTATPIEAVSPVSRRFHA